MLYEYLNFLLLIKDQILIYLGVINPPFTDVELDEILKKYLIREDDDDYYEF